MLIAKYTCNASGVVPIFNDEYEYEINETENNGIYTVEITSDNNFSNCSFNSKTQLLTVEFLKVTSKVTNMSIMFNNCNNLTSLDLSNFDTKNVTAMSNMFYGCKNLTSLDLSNFDTQNVIIMSNMFYGCTNLTSLDLSNFDTKNVTAMNAMFNSCTNLTSLDLSNFDTKNVTTMHGMFYGCKQLTSLDLSNFITSKVTRMSFMFNGCNNLTSLDVSNFDTSKVTSMSNMFQNCNNLTSLDLSNFETSNVDDMSYMFQNCNKLTSLDVSNFDTKNVTNMSYMFYSCDNLTSLDVSNFNTKNVTSMSYMFQNCNKLTSLDLSNFNTQNVANMGDMFNNCTNLTSLDVSNFDTKNVTAMNGMFSNCTNLTSLDLSNFDTGKVTNMNGMFSNCTNLTSLDLSNFDTSEVTSMFYMFAGCKNLTSLGLIYANIDTINQLPTPSTATLYINTNIDQTAYTGSSKLETYEQRTVTINIPTALRSNGEIADRLYWNDEDKHYYIEQNINPNTNETLETPNIIASGVKQPIYLKIYEDMLSVGISNIDASYMSINVPFFEIPTDYEYKWEDELDYIKQSFELRFPDEDDVPEGWGFMGIPGEEEPNTNFPSGAMLIDYWFLGSEKYTAVMKIPDSGYVKIETEAGTSFMMSYYDDEKWVKNGSRYNSGSNVQITEPNVTHFAVCTGNTPVTYITINGVKYYYNSQISQDGYGEPYMNDIYVAPGLKALIDWVDGCTDEEFVRDFDQHFNRDYTLRYFLLVITLGMVDNLGKNMMLDTWDNKIFMPRFYDCDTICSYDNSGQLKFDVDIEMAQGYWNTSSSRLWTRIRDLMHDELVAKYNNMRQNGLSYESLMECFYDEQIAKIPQKYYNMDYDVKYAPFADSYIGMANGDTYEHLKRWLQQRLRFVDTLYDYAPSYNNDVLTIRANTTEPMTLEIETYTPVYQHLSWYNNQMDKKKIDGKISVTFTGTAMAETDQEVLIYGGSNIKSIKGITSMNPNRMLIGSATRLIELDAPNCPLLADINANKANLAPHVYLNKVNLSGCPLLGGNLIINQSPLIREIDIRNTAITGLNLPSNLRNLEVLKLPAAIETLTLNDAGQLHTLEFEEGGTLQNVTMTNCNALTNITNFNLEDATSISLNNSYNTANELYFSKATNLSVSNMPNLERLIYTPNAEHEVFDKVNVDNASNYTVSTFNCPKLNTFMTTAPYRESYEKEYGEVKPNEVFEANTIDISNTQFTDVKLLCTTDTNVLKLPQTVKNLIIDSAYDLDTEYLTDGDYDVIHTELYEPYNTDYENNVGIKNISTMPIMINEVATELFAANAELYPKGYENEHPAFRCSQYIEVSPGDEISYTCNQEPGKTQIAYYDSDKTPIFFKGHATLSTQTGWNTAPSNARYVRMAFRYENITDFSINVSGAATPNIVPSASDGSLIFSMYAPHNTTEPASGVWDLKGLELDDYHAFGLNNDVKLVDNTLTMPDRLDEYSLSIKNKTVKNEIARYTASDRNTFPTFNSEFIYTYDVVPLDEEVYEYSIIADSMDNLPTQISFNGKSELLTVEYLNTSNVTNMSGMFYDCKNLTSLDVSNFDTKNVTSMKSMFDSCNNLTSLDVSNFDTSNVSNMQSMFYGCDKLTSLDVSNFDTKNVTSMQSMFVECKNLTSLDVSNFDTSNVTNMHNMFYGCNNLTSLDVSNFDTKNVTSMKSMFGGCNNLTSLDVSSLNTSNVTNMSGMFYDCKNLTSLDVSNFNTSNVNNMNNMFSGCNNLTSLDVSNFDTSKVTTMAYMFHGCNNLTSLDVGNFNTKNVTTMAYMFQDCNNSTSITFGSNFDTNKVAAMTNMFYGCTNLTSLDLSNFNTSNVDGMYFMFNGCSNLISLDLSNFDTKNVTNMRGMFNGCNSLQELHIETWPLNDVTQMGVSTLPVGDDERNEIYTSAYFTVPNGWTLYNALEIAKYTTNASGVLPTFNTEYTGYSTQETENEGIYTVIIATDSIDNLPTQISFSGKSQLLTVEYLKITSEVTNMNKMFHGCNNLISLDVSKWDTSKVTDMASMFQNCNQLTSLDVSNFDTTEVTNMASMFYGCNNLTSLDVSSFNTKNVTNMQSMFQNCNQLTSLDVSGFDTKNVTNMYFMFAHCNNLTSITFGSNWNTSEVTSMQNMFQYCDQLTSLDVSGFDTKNVTNMSNMFASCNKLTSLNVSSFDTKNVTTMTSMFQNCNQLTSLDVSGFDTKNVTNMYFMFAHCTNLTSITFGSNWNTSEVTSMQSMFHNCNQLTSLDLSSFDTKNVTNMFDMFAACRNLKSLDSMMNISKSLHLSSTFLDASSLLDVIDNLATVTTTQTLSLGATLLAKLTEEQIAVATNKGWTVV